MDLLTLADINSGAYKFTLVLHVLAAIIGIGTVFLNGLRGSRSQKKGEQGALAESAGIAEDVDRTSAVAEWFIYAVPLLGVGLVFMSDDVWDFGQTWIWLSLVLYASALAVSLIWIQPTSRKIAALTREMADGGPPLPGAQGPPPQVAELDRLGTIVGASSGYAHTMVVVILFLMIWKPGL